MNPRLSVGLYRTQQKVFAAVPSEDRRLATIAEKSAASSAPSVRLRLTVRPRPQKIACPWLSAQERAFLLPHRPREARRGRAAKAHEVVLFKAFPSSRLSQLPGLSWRFAFRSNAAQAGSAPRANISVNRTAGNTHRSTQAPCPAAGYLGR